MAGITKSRQRSSRLLATIEAEFDAYYGPLLIGQFDGRRQRFRAAETISPAAAEREHCSATAYTAP
jgi:hypothetical protein